MLEKPDAPRAKAASVGLGMMPGWMRLNTLPGMNDAAGLSARDLDQRVLPGSVNAGEAQDCDCDVLARAKIQPGLLDGEALAAARRARLRRRWLVGPGGVAAAG